MEPSHPRRLHVAAWVTYDLANTIFALGVIGYYCPRWLDDMDLADSVLAGVQVAAAVVVVFLAPWSGARTDASGVRMPTLIATTLVAVIATALLASGPIALTVALLWLAVIGVNTGSVVYDALLPNVSTSENRGWISGLGIGVGYLGSFVGLAIGYVSFEVLGWGYAGTFRTMALAFLLFAIPCFLLVPEPPRAREARPGLHDVIAHLLASWRLASRHRGVVRFLVGRFLYTDAINTLVGGFLTIFVIRELGFTDDELTILLAITIAAAMIGGLAAGRILERVAPLPLLRVVLVMWIVALGAGVIANVTGVTSIAWAIGILGGAALGGTWAADRMVMYRISPPRHLGEFYGLYATVGRFATIVGPLMWAIVVDVLRLGRNTAMLTLAGFVGVGLLVLRRVDDDPRVWSPEDLVQPMRNPDGGRT